MYAASILSNLLYAVEWHELGWSFFPFFFLLLSEVTDLLFRTDALDSKRPRAETGPFACFFWVG